MIVETDFATKTGGYRYVSKGDEITVYWIDVGGDVMEDFAYTTNTAGKEEYQIIDEMVSDITESEEACTAPMGVEGAVYSDIEESVRLHVSKHFKYKEKL